MKVRKTKKIRMKRRNRKVKVRKTRRKIRKRKKKWLSRKGRKKRKKVIVVQNVKEGFGTVHRG